MDKQPKHYPYSSLTVGNERIMLVGGAGFIGHNLALELRRKGAEVLILDNLQINNIVNVVTNTTLDSTRRRVYTKFLLDRFELLRSASVEIMNVDSRQMSEFANVFSEFEPTKVVHMAAISSAVTANKMPGLAWDLEINGLRNIIELARMKDSQVKQLMVMSSSTVYGDFEQESVNEHMRPRPKGVYANGKYIVERMVREAERLYGLSYTIIRPSALYGERCISGRVSQKFVENALLGKSLILEGGGSSRLDFTYIQDLVVGMVRALAIKAALSRTFNITFGNSRSIFDLVTIIKEHIPDVVVEERAADAEKPKRGTLMIDHARQHLDFEPQYPLETGYSRYVEWYVQQWEEVKSRI